jgi:DNA-directed RNA polymerase alpha subunit
MMMKKTEKTCKKGHTFYKSSDCPTCPICEKEKKPEGIFADMGSPVRHALEHAGIKTLKQLSKKTEKEILDMHGVGPSSMPIFKKKLQKEGLSFKISN